MGIMDEAPTWAGTVWPEAEFLMGSAQGLPELLTALLVCREKKKTSGIIPGKPRQERKGAAWESFPGAGGCRA